MTPTFRDATEADLPAVVALLHDDALGAALVAHALAEARAAGATLAQLTSNEARTDAQRFWRAQGFERTHAGFKAPLVRDGGAEGR